MPLQPGEVSLLSLYADVHYFFSPPNARPIHHRFDKRSYVYLYHDALKRRGRLEIANHAGTPEQDAFQGYLDSADIEYSYKHPTLFTITVQGRVLANQSPATSPQQDISQWHLPYSDVHNSQAKYMFRLHTVDMYFWTAEDAELFVDSLKRVVVPGQLRILDANTTHPEHRDSMSPVVQQLEKAAIVQPPAQQQNHAQRSNSISTTHTTKSNAPNAANAVAGAAAGAQIHTPVSPPTSPPVSEHAPPAQPIPQPPQAIPPPPAQPQSFAPIAYNPAAPAAPEPIAHREKTPPPPDAEAGTGLMAAAAQDVGVHPQQPPPGFMMGSNPLQQSFSPQPTAGGYIPGPPSGIQPGIQRANTIALTPSSVPGAPSAPQQQPSPYQQQPQFAGPPQQASPDPNAHLYAQHAHHAHHAQQQSPAPGGLVRQNTMPIGFAPQGYAPQQQPGVQYAYSPSPSGTPGALPPQSPGIYQPGQPPQQQPQGGYYHPAQSPPLQQSYGINHGMHQQVYIPDGQHAPAQHTPASDGPPSKLENRLKNAEKGVSGWGNKFLKKLDKKI